MRAPAVSFVRKIAAAAAVGLLACGLALPHAPAFAEGEDAPSALLASLLMDGSASVVRGDVALAAPEDDAEPEPVIGSFTVDGLTFAVTEGSSVQLVGVSPDWQQATGLQAGEGSPQPSMSASEAEGSDAGGSALLLAETVAYNNVEYALTSIGAYAFYLSGVASVELSASIVDVDDRAFRSSDVASVEVAGDNPNYSSFDGVLYDADQLSLLLIPEGKQGTVLLPSTAESVSPSVFSHCPLVTQIAVEEGSAAFASENGLLYDASLEVLLRVPAGATDITIREGCTTIAAGALEACANLECINAPASVTSISPYLFEQQPETVMAPVAVAAVEDDAEGGLVDEVEPAEVAPQLSTMVALTSTDDDLPAADPVAVAVLLPAGADVAPWHSAGFSADEPQGDAEDDASIEDGEGEEPDLPIASLGSASTYAGAYDFTIVNAEGSTLYQTNSSGSTNTQIESRVIGCGAADHQVHVRFLSKGGSLIVQLWHSTTEDNSYYRWVKTGYVLVGVKVTNGAGTVTDEIRATEVGTSYKGTSAIKGAGRTIAPIFEKVTYTVKLNGNGATTMGTDSVQVGYGQSMPAITVPTRTGYAFAGHTEKSDGSGTKYYDEKGKSLRAWDRYQEYPTSLSSSFDWGTLYAQWRTVSLSVDAAGGKAVQIVPAAGGGWQMDYENAQEIWNDVLFGTKACTVTATGRIDYYNSAGSWVPIQLERTGYVFTGWKDLSIPDGQTKVFEAGQDVTLTATWRLEHLKVNAGGAAIHVGSDVQSGSTYEADFWPESIRVIYGRPQVNFYDSSLNLHAVTLVRPGYVFTGWEEVSLGLEEEKRLTSGDLTLTATWRLATVSINGSGGTVAKYVQNASGAWVLDRDNAREVWTDERHPDVAAKVYGYGRVEYWSATHGWHALLVERPGYVFAGWKEIALSHDAVSEYETGRDLTLTAIWRKATILIDGGGGIICKYVQTPSGSWTLDRDNGKKKWEDERYPKGPIKVLDYGRVEYYSDTQGWHALLAERAGYIFAGWSRSADGPIDPNLSKEYDFSEIGDLALYAHWTPAISADMPIEVTAEVDLLGIEDQVPASGYIESRCGAPLAVEEVSFTALAGAEDLFGEANTASVSLQALALEGDASWDASTPTFSFPLSADATESDASKLTALRMKGYEDHIPIGYRFAIPEDVLASIDPARFEQVTTPVCSVSYTVALASA